MADDDRKYIVRVLATMLCTHMQRPGMKHCAIVAESLLRKHNFLKESVSCLVSVFFCVIIVFIILFIEFVEAVYIYEVPEH